MTAPVVFANLPTGENPLSLFDQMFAYVISLIGSAGVTFQPTVVDASSINVDAAWPALVINRTVGGASTAVNLPPVADRDGLSLIIADWAGNAGDIIVTPDGSETIMGLASATLQSSAQGVGTAGSIRLFPSTSLNGWYVG